ncbi:MAG: PEP-CTERM sorting domain-containing protein [Caldimonas sp.]
MKQAVATMAVWMAAACGPFAAASAAPIFADDFNRAVSASVGNGWSEVESDAVDVSIVARADADREMQVRDDDPRGIASQRAGISTLGYASVSLAYEWAPSNNTEAGDLLWVEWRDGANGANPWTVIASHALAGPSGHSAALQDVIGGGDIADFEFRFRVAVDSNNEGALIDNVVLSGTSSTLQVQAVPEPGSLALAGFALVLMSAATLGRRARRVVSVRPSPVTRPG